MTRKLIATIAAAAIALSGLTATPAAALDDREVVKLLLGAAAVGVLVNELNKKNKKEIAAENAYRNNTSYRYDDNRYDDNRYDNNRYDNNSRSSRANRNRVIPQACVFDIRTRNGYRDVVSGHCVERSNFRGNLPKDCKFQVRRNGRSQTVYGANCLRDRGIRIASARR